MAKLMNSPNLGTTDLDIIAPKHALSTLKGAFFVACGFLTLGAVGIYGFTDISFTEWDSCNTGLGYPKVPQVGLVIGISVITIIIGYILQNPEIMRITCLRAEVWLSICNSLINVVFMTSLYRVLLFLESRDKHAMELLEEHAISTSFLLICTINMFARCMIPTIYHEFVFKQQSKLTDIIREQFEVAEKQPFSMNKLVEQVSSELEMDSLLLYEVVRTILKLRKSTNDTFERSELLSKFVIDNYVHGTRKTLDYYGLRSIVDGVNTPIELLEREATVLRNLKVHSRERIVLPMFARMVKQNGSKVMEAFA